MADPEPTKPTPEGGTAFTELSSEDPAATRRFLERVFRWKFRSIQMPSGEYLSYQTPDGQGGIRSVRGGEPPASLTYIRVRDLREAQNQVEAAGAEVVLPRVDVPGMGCFFWFRVPGGPVLACWQDLAP